MGWFGLRSDVLKVLDDLNTEKNECSGHMVRGNIYRGLYPEELLLGDHAEYRINGEWKSLTDLMNHSHYGLSVAVID
jgi:hypothetical protein